MMWWIWGREIVSVGGECERGSVIGVVLLGGVLKVGMGECGSGME